MIETSLIVAGAAIGGNILLGVGLAVAWNRNGRSAAGKYGALETEVRNIGSKVDALACNVRGMDKAVGEFKVHCAGVSGRLDERTLTNEREIHDIKAEQVNRKGGS